MYTQECILGIRGIIFFQIKQRSSFESTSKIEFDSKDVKVVIGQDIFQLLFPMDHRKEKKNEPWAVKTKLGWTLSGPLPKNEIAQLATAFATTDNDQLSEQVISGWSMESYASNGNISGRSRDDQRSTEILVKTRPLVGDRYEVGLLWAEKKEIPNNYNSAYTQLRSMQRRLEKKSDLK